MFFRNLTFFRIPPSLADTYRLQADQDDAFDALLREHPLQPVGALAMASYGFVSPHGGDHDGTCAHVAGDATWIALGGEEKLLTPAAITKATADRMKAASERIGLSISGKQRRRFREEAVADMLPKAFVQAKRTDAYLDWSRGFLVVDTSSRKVAEHVVSEIRHATGSFPALPLNAGVSPRAILTGWLAGEPMPDGFTLGEECELRSPHDHGGIVKCSRVDLADEDIIKHLESGKQCTRLALVYRDHVSFVFGEDLVLRKVKFLDGAVEALEDQEHDTARQELDARFALMAGETAQLFDALAEAFKFSAIEDPQWSEEERAQRSAEGAPPAALNRIKPRKKRGALEGISSVTISGAGMSPVTLSGEQFANLPKYAARIAEIIRWVRDNENTTISGMQRYLKCGYNEAARVVEALEHSGVVGPPGPDGKRPLLPMKSAPINSQES